MKEDPMRRIVGAIASIAVLCACTPPLEARPTWRQPADPEPESAPVFANLTFDEGRAKARQDQTYLIVSARTKSCPHSKQMSEAAWRAEGVVAWIEANAVAAELDIDEQSELARILQINETPTIIAYEYGSREHSRIVGHHDPSALLDWLEDIVPPEGAAPDDDPAERGERPPSSISLDDLRRAQALVAERRFDEATDQYLDLFDRSVERDQAWLTSMRAALVSAIEELAAQHGPARERLTDRRDELSALLESDRARTWEQLGAWLDLNTILGDDGATLEWIDRIKDDRDSSETTQRFMNRISELLIEYDRWDDLGEIIDEPVDAIHWASMQLLDEQPPPGSAPPDRIAHAEVHRWYFVRRASEIHAALLAAGREREARITAEFAIDILDGPKIRLFLVETAIKARQGRPMHRQLISELLEADSSLDLDNLSERLEHAIEQAKNEPS